MKRALQLDGAARHCRGLAVPTHLTFYRLWCGKKRYSSWLADHDQLLRVAMAQGLAFGGDSGAVHLGPLTRIEVGTRKYARSKTVPVK